MKQPRSEERYAFEMVSRATGWRIVPFDDNRAERMVDGVFELPDGRRGAIEVTTITEPAAMALDRLTAGRLGPFEFLRNDWHVIVPDDYRTRERGALPALLAQCEALGIGSLHDAEIRRQPMPAEVIGLVDRGVQATAQPTSRPAGMIDVFAEHLTGGGAVPDDADLLTSWLESVLATPGVVRHVEKLADHSADVRHLFLRVHETACSFAELYALQFGVAIPSMEPTVPEVLDAVWLGLRIRNPLLWWSRDGGWQRADVHDK